MIIALKVVVIIIALVLLIPAAILYPVWWLCDFAHPKLGKVASYPLGWAMMAYAANLAMLESRERGITWRDSYSLLVFDMLGELRKKGRGGKV